MNPSLVQGRIVWAELLDPQGRNPKQRPAVILTKTEEIKSEEPFVVVGATTTFTEPLPEMYVKLPWHPAGRVRTHLKKPTVAVCDCLVPIRVADVRELAGIVPPTVMMEIVEKCKSAAARRDRQAP